MKKTKGLIILRGMTFRSKNESKLQRIIGFFNQVKATKSHKRFVDYISKKYDIQFDIALDTVETQLEGKLVDILKDKLIYCKVNKFVDNFQIPGLLRILSDLNQTIFDYDFVLIIRNDVQLFKSFQNIFNPFEQRIMFPFVHDYNGRKVYGNSKWPIVCDTFMFIPKQYYQWLNVLLFIQPPICHMHDVVHIAKEDCKFDFDFGVYINTYHNTNTSEDWNPLYKIVYKKHAKKQISDKNLTYPEDY